MKSYVNTHAQLEARRDKALQALQAGRTNVTGPRVRGLLVVGCCSVVVVVVANDDVVVVVFCFQISA